VGYRRNAEASNPRGRDRTSRGGFDEGTLANAVGVKACRLRIELKKKKEKGKKKALNFVQVGKKRRFLSASEKRSEEQKTGRKGKTPTHKT